jgi:hypothetical protein
MAVQLGKLGTRTLVATCLALGFTTAAPFATIAPACADGHNIVDADGTWGAPDGPQQRGTSIVPAIHSIDTSANTVARWPAAPTWPAPPSWGSYPAPSSYPADPSWPGSGWGIADN